MTKLVLITQHETLGQMARWALNLGRYADAETAARAPVDSAIFWYDPKDQVSWGQVLLAQALAGQDRKAEALKIVEPARAKYSDMQTQGASYVEFRQHFTRALYVQAQPNQPTRMASPAAAPHWIKPPPCCKVLPAKRGNCTTRSSCSRGSVRHRIS